MKDRIYLIIDGILVLVLGSIIIRSCSRLAVEGMNEVSETTI